MEWQSEANFFTLRVRGKQWYWVYKFDFQSVIKNLYTNNQNNCIGYRSLFIKNTPNCKQNIYLLFNSLLKTKHYDTFLARLAESIQLKQNTLSIHNSFFCNRNCYETRLMGNFYLTYKPTFLVTLNILSSIKRLRTFNVIGSQIFNSFTSDITVNRFSRDIFFSSNSLNLIKSINSINFTNDSLLTFRYNYNNIKPFNNNFYIVLKQKPISD